MRLSIFLLANFALAKAPKSRKIQHGFRSEFPNTGSLLAARQRSCDDDELFCGVDYCMPEDATCCFEGDGSYCDNGSLCVDGGCCELGDTCDGTSEGVCGDDEEKCGIGCMPKGSVCCEAAGYGTYCDAGQTCDGYWCDRGSENAEDENSDDENDDDDDGPHLCARRRGGGGGGGDDDCDGAGTTSASLLLAGFVVVISFLL